MIILDKVTKAYHNEPILQGVSLQLAPGKTHVLLGSSGCGKSTLLRIILGLIEADSGQVTLGDVAASLATQQKLALMTGYVPQHGGLFPHMTARANIELASRVLGWPASKRRLRVSSLVQLLGIDSKILDKYPSELSGGQRQKVALVRALMLDPAYLIMDEPLGSLDPMVRSTMQEELKRLFNTLNKTVLMVTHDLQEAAHFGNTITMMRKGCIEQHGTYEKLMDQPESSFVSQFLTAQPQEVRSC